MSKKVIKGEDGKEYVVKERKKWYKGWPFWSGVVVLLAIIGGGYAAYSHYQYEQDYQATQNAKNDDEVSDSDTDSSSSSDTNKSAESNDTQTAELLDGTKVHIKSTQSYSTNYGDTTYGGDLEFTSVTVGTTKPFTYDDDDNGDTTEHGYIAVKEKYTAGSEDMTLFDDQAVLNTSDGQQINIDSDDSQLVDDVNAGATKRATLIFMVPNITKTNQFSSIRIKMDAAPQNLDSSSMHTYDATIQLNADKT